MCLNNCLYVQVRLQKIVQNCSKLFKIRGRRHSFWRFAPRDSCASFTLSSLRSQPFSRKFWPEIPLDSADLISLIGRFSCRSPTPVATVLNHGPSFCIRRVSVGLCYSHSRWVIVRSGRLFHFGSGAGPVAPGGCFAFSFNAFPFSLTTNLCVCVSVFGI